MDFKKLKILLVNHSDARGGAAVVTHRLMDALCAEGVDTRMLVVHKDSDSLRVAEAATSRRAALPFLAEHADIFLHNGFNRESVFKISTGRFGLPLHRHPWVKNADAIILNWVNQGFLSLDEINRIASEKPVIWTMHDQWNMTGVCHYTDSCRNFLTGCSDCHLMPKSSIPQKVFRRKLKLYHSANIRFVAVSNCLAERCRKSPLMVDADMRVIPNAMPVNKFTPKAVLSRSELGLPDNKKIVVMGASRLDDPVKNLPLAISTLNKAGDSIFPVFFGNIRNPLLLDSLYIKHLWMGPVNELTKLQSLMAHADVVLSTSVWETLPGTLVEGISCGAAGVATGNGGQSDIITDGITGFIAECDPNSTLNDQADRLADALHKALLLPFDMDARWHRHRLMVEKFAAPAVARAYISLISEALRTE